MKISFFGVRGSIPASGPDTAKYGGETSCVYIELDDNRHIILDAGTGLRKLGQQLLNHKKQINMLLSHGHWDHIQGYPFFMPAYQPERVINLFDSGENGDKVLDSLMNQLNGLNFPVHREQLLARTSLIKQDALNILSENNINIISKPLNHPGGGVAYKILEEGMSIAYVTDNELDPPYALSTTYDQWVEFLMGVDVLIHDAQYTQEDMPHKHGWGHSLISQVRKLAVDAQVGTLVMFHHDPDRTDTELDEIQIENEKHLRSHLSLAKSVCAYQGMQIVLKRSKIDNKTTIDIL